MEIIITKEIKMKADIILTNKMDNILIVIITFYEKLKMSFYYYIIYPKI
jgi:hypothetical protein